MEEHGNYLLTSGEVSIVPFGKNGVRISNHTSHIDIVANGRPNLIKQSSRFYHTDIGILADQLVSHGLILLILNDSCERISSIRIFKAAPDTALYPMKKAEDLHEWFYPGNDYTTRAGNACIVCYKNLKEKGLLAKDTGCWRCKHDSAMCIVKKK